VTVDEEALEAFKLLAKERGFEALKDRVVSRDLCSGCGTCSAVCPKDCIEFSPKGQPIMKRDAECRTCGLCAVHCPRSFMDTEEIEAKLFTGKRDDLGYYIEKLAARAADEGVRAAAQDGGVVSAILKHLFENGEIDGAVVSKANENYVGVPYLAHSWEEAMTASRSKYNLSPNLVALRQAREEKLERVALVGLPCHIAAFRKLELGGPKNLTRRVSLAIGLFCSENFCDDMVTDFLPGRGVDPKKITKMDIKGKFLVQSGEDVVGVPLPEMEPVVNPGCLACQDFSAELADVSVGAVGARRGWCSVVVRTSKGQKVVRDLVESGALETGKLIKPKTLKRMSRSKRIRGRRKLVEIMGGEGAKPYQQAASPSMET
jgi:coenzyme F420 hydrogenase subunit beta